MKLQVKIYTTFGEFNGEIIETTEEEYTELTTRSSTYYKEGFEMVLEDGSFVVIPPDLIRTSVLKIIKIT